MKLIQDDEKFKMAYISGPKHIFLSLAIGGNSSENNFTLIDISDTTIRNSTQTEDITNQITKGLKKSNNMLGIKCKIVLSEYCSNDTLCDNIYSKLTFEILKQAYHQSLLNKYIST